MSNKRHWLSEKDYNFIFDQIPRLCVDVVIKSKQGVVLSWREIEPAKNTWHIPGGRVYFRETLKQAAERIATEETGLKVRAKDVLGVIEYALEVQYGHRRHTVGVVIEAQSLSRKLEGSRQAEKIKFFKKLPVKTFKAHRQFFKKNKIF